VVAREELAMRSIPQRENLKMMNFDDEMEDIPVKVSAIPESMMSYARCDKAEFDDDDVKERGMDKDYLEEMKDNCAE
jgi:hypothetical protein